MVKYKIDKALVINNGSKYEEDIVALCQKHGMQVDVIDWRQYDGGYFNHDMVILSGGHTVTVNDHEKQFAGQIELIQKCQVPVIGICLGFELIIKSFGGKLIEMPDNEKGEVTVNKLIDDDIFEGIDKIKVFENHKWKVPEVPYCLVPLASSNYGIEVVKHITQPIYGFQFHPEESDYEDCGVRLFENILTKLRVNS